MSIKAAILLLLVICALGLASGPGLRRLVARVSGLGRRPRLLRDPREPGTAFRLGRLAGRLSARRRDR